MARQEGGSLLLPKMEAEGSEWVAARAASMARHAAYPMLEETEAEGNEAGIDERRRGPERRGPAMWAFRRPIRSGQGNRRENAGRLSCGPGDGRQRGSYVPGDAV